MAIKIPIVTVFDNKGLKQAAYQLNKVQGNFRNLGRNFAVAGAAFAGFAVMVGKSAQSLARIETINAQTAQVIKSMGNAANISAGQVETLAGKLEALTATEAESIQEGANLLLTFKNISNQMGDGNDIFNQTTAIMVDMARVLKSSTTQEAIRLGKALNDPVRGLTALRKVGVSFTEQQVEQVKALQESGDLLGAQKIILAELNAQFGGQGAAYAATFAGQLELLNHELGAVGEEATMALMPALQTMVQEFRNLIPVIGPQLKEAIESVDWQALATTLTNLITFFVENADAIFKTVTAIWALNTAYNLGIIAVGLYKAATILLKAQLEATTIKARLLRAALLLTGVAAAVIHVADTYAKARQEIEKATPQVSAFNKEVYASSTAAAELNPLIKAYHLLAKAIFGAVIAQNQLNPKNIKPGQTSVLDSYAYNLKVDQPTPKNKKKNEKSLEKQLEDLMKGLETSGAGTKAAKNAGTKAGQNWQSGFLAVMQANQQKIAKKISDFVGSIPIKDEWAEFGSSVGNDIVKSLQRNFKRVVYAPGSTRIFKELYNKVAKLQDAFVARTKLQTQIKEDIMSMFDFKTIKTGLSGIIKQFKDQVEQTRKFRDNLVELQKLGLSQDLFRQIAETQDFTTAAELVKGGADAVNEINTLFGELQGFADEIATVSGNALYNLGVDAASGYVRTLEDGFAALNREQKLATDKLKLESKIKQLLDLQKSPFQMAMAGYTPSELKKELAQLQERLLLSFGPDGTQTQKLADLTARTGLDQYFLGGGQLTPDIAAQLEYLGMGRKAREQADMLERQQRREERRNGNITVNVNGGISTSAQIGQSIVDAIRAYERSSGQVYSRA